MDREHGGSRQEPQVKSLKNEMWKGGISVMEISHLGNLMIQG
jgi:hypothetical protein